MNRATGLVADGAYGGPRGWMVAFRYRNDRTDPRARRAVIVDGQGRRIHILHQDAD